MLEVFNTWFKGRPIPPMLWSRHGPIPVVLNLIFIKFGKLFLSADFGLSLEPVLSTSLLVVVLFLWLRKLCSAGMSLLLAVTAAFGTMLWPYAYIGLETKQSLFVMLAAYLGLASGKIQGWPKLIQFAVVCGLALNLKATGIVMWPAIAYLIYAQFHDEWRSRIPEMLVTSSIVAAIMGFGYWSQKLYWGPLGGGANNIRPWMIHSPFQIFPNALALFGSPTKGVFLYAPILLVSIFCVARAFRRDRHVAIFTVLLTACVVGFMSLMTFGSDEVWGPRYMHPIVAPFILCIGAAWPKFEWRRHFSIVILSLAGIIISFLGAFYYYGIQDFAMLRAGQNTMEWINGDPLWNDMLLHARLFDSWMREPKGPDNWTPSHLWVWEAPKGALPWAAIDLREFNQPQSALLGLWDREKSGNDLLLFRLCKFSLYGGPLFLILTLVSSFRITGKSPVPEIQTVPKMTIEQ